LLSFLALLAEGRVLEELDELGWLGAAERWEWSSSGTPDEYSGAAP
jgi:hypothetical protein